jgi:hypothetical protein
MPLDTFALMLSDVIAGLGFPAKALLEVEDAARALDHRVTLRALHRAQSGERWSTARSPFTPSQGEREKALPAVQGTPLWVERKAGTEPNETWVYVPAANEATVEEARARGDERVAFFYEKGQLKVRLSWTPDGATTYRVVYRPPLIPTQAINDQLPFPAEFGPFVVAETMGDLIPGILINLTSDKDNPPAREAVSAWGALAGRVEKIVADWEPLWRQERLASKGGARGRNRRSVLPGGGWRGM